MSSNTYVIDRKIERIERKKSMSSTLDRRRNLDGWRVFFVTAFVALGYRWMLVSSSIVERLGETGVLVFQTVAGTILLTTMICFGPDGVLRSTPVSSPTKENAYRSVPTIFPSTEIGEEIMTYLDTTSACTLQTVSRSYRRYVRNESDRFWRVHFGRTFLFRNTTDSPKDGWYVRYRAKHMSYVLESDRRKWCNENMPRLRRLCEDFHRTLDLNDALWALPNRHFCGEARDSCPCRSIPWNREDGTVYAPTLLEPMQRTFHINAPIGDGSRCNLLATAARAGCRPAVKLLIRKGANPNHRDVNGNTPLHYAFAYRHYDVASWLIRHTHADDSVTNASGLSVYDGLA